MSDHTQLIARLAARNPVPDLDQPPIGTLDHEELRLVLMRRETAMQTQERTKPSPVRPPQRKGWLVAAAAFVAVLIVGVVVIVGNGGSDLEVSDQSTVAPSTTTTSETPTTSVAPTTAALSPHEATAEALLVAVLNGDLDAALATASDTTVTQDVEFATLYGIAINTAVISVVCAVGNSDTVVTCETTYTDDIHELFGIDGRETWTVRFNEDGTWRGASSETTEEDAVEVFLDGAFDENPWLIEDGGPCNAVIGGDSPPGDCARALLQLALEATS